MPMQCSIEGCAHDALIVCYPDDHDELDPTVEYVCEEHLYDFGFCPGCYQFTAGSSADFHSYRGLYKYCGDCAEYLMDELNDDYDDDEY